MSGWVKIHRDIKNHWIWRSGYKFQWWVDILLTVNYSDNKILIRGQVIDCKRGQSIRSLETWAREWNVSKRTVKKFFELLQKDAMIEIENIQISTRITVCNYDVYQDKVDGLYTDSTRIVNGQYINTTHNKENKKDKKDNKEKNKKIQDSLLSEHKSSDDLYVKIAINFWSLFKSNSEMLKIVSIDLPKAKYSAWVEPVRLMIERDKRTIEEFHEIFKYLQDETPRENGFSWSANLRSTYKLREKFEIILKDARTKNSGKVSKVANTVSRYQSISKKINEGTFK